MPDQRRKSVNQVMEHSCYFPEFGETIHGIAIRDGQMEVVDLGAKWKEANPLAGPGMVPDSDFMEALTEYLHYPVGGEGMEARLEVELPSGLWIVGVGRRESDQIETGSLNLLLPDGSEVYGPLVLVVVHRGVQMSVGGLAGLLGLAVQPVEWVQGMQPETRTMLNLARWPNDRAPSLVIRDPHTGRPMTERDFQQTQGSTVHEQPEGGA